MKMIHQPSEFSESQEKMICRDGLEDARVGGLGLCFGWLAEGGLGESARISGKILLEPQKDTESLRDDTENNLCVLPKAVLP